LIGGNPQTDVFRETDRNMDYFRAKADIPFFVSHFFQPHRFFVLAWPGTNGRNEKLPLRSPKRAAVGVWLRKASFVTWAIQSKTNRINAANAAPT